MKKGNIWNDLFVYSLLVTILSAIIFILALLNMYTTIAAYSILTGFVSFTLCGICTIFCGDKDDDKDVEVHIHVDVKPKE